MKKLIFLPFLVYGLVWTAAAQDSKEKPKKMTAAEVVAKHLESIGKKDDIASIKSRVLVGEGTLSSKLKNAQTIGGPAQFASTGDMVLMAMVFNARDYPYEKAAFDGKNVTVGFPDGRKSVLANFIQSQNVILKEGLFGGVLSSAWPLLDVNGNKAKLDFSGMTKIDGREVYKLKYTPHSGGLRVTFYFDAENFHHVQTDYEYTIQPQMGATATSSVSSQESHYKMTEKFSDFKTVGKLTLPFDYLITIDTQGQTFSPGGSNVLNWEIKIVNVYYDEALESGVFKVS